MYKYVLYFAVLFKFFKYYYTKQQNNISHTFDITSFNLYNKVTKLKEAILCYPNTLPTNKQASATLFTVTIIYPT